MISDAYCAVYDFGLMPYALGDVLTWNVHSAIHCEQRGRARVDTFICLDESIPSNLFQRDFVTAENSHLLFNELFGAFGTHPSPGNVHFYRRRETMLERLRELAAADEVIAESVTEYERTIAALDDKAALIRYFTKYAYSHQGINAFFEARGRIPRLRSSTGCAPDVDSVVTKRFAGKRIVTIHMRHRRLDIGYGGEISYTRDSDFLEWYEFLREAGKKHPDVQFVALGRQQEKPVELLNLPNVASLRSWGLGLGHELTLMLRGDLFIGASSGFAAMAYFSEVPYFITRMTQAACKAYTIDFGAKRFPFGSERQILVYEPETKELLMRLLEQGLEAIPGRGGGSGPTLDPTIDVRSWEWERSQWLSPGATSYRFFDDAVFADKETAFLIWPLIREAQDHWRAGESGRSLATLERIEANFPRMCERFPEFLRLRMALASSRKDLRTVERCKANLMQISDRDRGYAGLVRSVKRYLARGFPAATRLKYFWNRKHRIPQKLVSLLRRPASTQGGS
ncbi:MAG: hypothetical protein HYY78_15860 [Betaproteobacteria bacterium]|nr:hypothetical protein [Betaproteobacteria bacterium]